MAIAVVFFDLGDTLVDGAVWKPGARKCVEALRADGVGLGVLSNTGALSREEVLAILPPDFSFAAFEEELVLLSSEVGIAKPDVRIFRVALDRSGVPKRDVLFVGESLAETWSAQAAGMSAMRVAAFPKDLEEIATLVASERARGASRARRIR